MTLRLRQAHRYIWFTLGVVLPVLWVAAVCHIPAPPWQTPLEPHQAQPLPVLLQSKEKEGWIVNLRSDSIGQRHQVEVILKKPLNAPNLSLIQRHPDGKAQLLGLLGARGVWRFPLDRMAEGVQLTIEDRIHDQILYTITF